MNTRMYDCDTAANFRLIAQVAAYYNDARKNLEFYREINNAALQQLGEEHLQHWKNELRSLIFSGMNCRERSL